MASLNCWEFKKCGREVGGIKTGKLGICPACKEKRVDGINNGKNGGRICWMIAGTLCNGTVQGTFASKAKSCMNCDFYKLVLKEQNYIVASASEVLEKLKS